MPVIINGSTGISGTDGSAATPAVQGTDTNTGIYFPGADRIGFAEGGVQVGEFDASGNFQFNSGYGSVATAYGCRAWVNFTGVATVSIRSSGNVTSITDNNTGDFTVNFTTAMPDANYAAVITAETALAAGSFADLMGVVNGGRATGSVRITCINSTDGVAERDPTAAMVAIFR